MIPKTVEVCDYSCRTDSNLENEEWIVYITSIDPVMTATGYGVTEDEAFENAKVAFQQTANPSASSTVVV